MRQARVLAALHVLFFCSGMASLICEVVWFKQLGFVLGSSTFSATVVVACFFGGLSLGSALLGRVADRVRHPLYVYAALELSLGAAALMTTSVLASWEQWIGVFTPWMSVDATASRPLKVALALPILLPPTVLMGATLPVLSRFIVRSTDELAERIGWLYALNTLGAAVGCALVGWVLIGAVGVFASAGIGAAIYVGIGLIGLGLAATTDAPAVPEDAPEPTVRTGPLPWVWIALFGGSGFVAIGYEVLWFRMLRYHAAHTVYTFSTFLSVYLVGLVIGSAICARWLAPHKATLAANFARVQVAIGVAALMSFAVLGQSRNILHVTSHDNLAGGASGGLVLLAVVVLLPPTVLLGLAFPLASELAVESVHSVGSRIGLLYGVNTLGGVLGSLVTGFLLLPFLGTQLSFEVLIAANFALFGVIWWLDPGLRKRREVRREVLLAIGMVGIAMVVLGQDWLERSQTAFVGGEVLDFRENADAAFVIMEYQGEHTGPYQQIIVNGTSYANNQPEGRRYMAVLAHLPMLLHDAPHQAVVICVGTGTTIGAVSLYPDLEQAYAVDLSSTVFDVAKYFVPINHSFLDNPRVRPVVADGRHFLLVADGTYDVLTFEPPPPQQAGVVNLYTREFYDLADQRMAPDGLVAQWIPFHQGYVGLQKSLVRTIMDRYPHTSMWISNGGEGIVIASHTPLSIDPVRIAARMADPAIRGDLDAVGLDSVEELLAMFVSADDTLEAWVGDVPSLTDDEPTIEYFRGHANIPWRNHLFLADRESVDGYLSRPVPDRMALSRAKVQIEALWAAEDAMDDARWDEAIVHADRALAMEPDDRYLTYLAAQVRMLRDLDAD